MHLKKTVRKAKNVTTGVIIGVGTLRMVPNKKIGYRMVEKREWRKVQNVVDDNIRGVRYFATRNSSGNLEFLKKNINDIVPVKVHPNTKLHQAKR